MVSFSLDYFFCYFRAVATKRYYLQCLKDVVGLPWWLKW